jgi:hypothetical protein
MKNISTFLILLVGIPVISFVWFAAACNSHQFNPESLESLFTGWAFVAVIATFVDQYLAHREVLGAMKDQVDAIAKGARVQANATLFRFWNRRLRELSGLNDEVISGSIAKRLNGVRELLERDSS